MIINRNKIINPNRQKTHIQIIKELEELSFKEKPLWCKLGIHEYDCIFNGLHHVIACKHCFKMHRIYK